MTKKNSAMRAKMALRFVAYLYNCLDCCEPVNGLTIVNFVDYSCDRLKNVDKVKAVLDSCIE